MAARIPRRSRRAATRRRRCERCDPGNHSFGAWHRKKRPGLLAHILGISTREDTKGVATANTEVQLKTKTWSELSKWHRLMKDRGKFTLGATVLHSSDADHEKTRRVDQIRRSEGNTEVFSGPHNKGNRVLLVLDEASAIPDIIWEVSEGASTDSNIEILWITFGSLTRNTRYTGGEFCLDAEEVRAERSKQAAETSMR